MSDTMRIDPVTLQTNLGNIFVCGELALGKKPFINAIGSGKEAAVSIDRSLRRVSLRDGRDLPVILGKPTPEEVEAYKEEALLTRGAELAPYWRIAFNFRQTIGYLATLYYAKPLSTGQTAGDPNSAFLVLAEAVRKDYVVFEGGPLSLVGQLSIRGDVECRQLIAEGLGNDQSVSLRCDDTAIGKP